MFMLSSFFCRKYWPINAFDYQSYGQGHNGTGHEIVKARSHRQNFAGAVLERYGDEPNFDNARHRAQKIENTGVAKAEARVVSALV